MPHRSFRFYPVSLENAEIHDVVVSVVILEHLYFFVFPDFLCLVLVFVLPDLLVLILPLFLSVFGLYLLPLYLLLYLLPFDFLLIS